jgi:hypothetical protein
MCRMCVGTIGADCLSRLQGVYLVVVEFVICGLAGLLGLIGILKGIVPCRPWIFVRAWLVGPHEGAL